MEKRGITLIALVITIIVLLILAGITISLTIGDQGIITRAQQASKNYKEAESKEKEELDNFDGEVENLLDGITTETYVTINGEKVTKKNVKDYIGKKVTNFKDVGEGTETIHIGDNETGKDYIVSTEYKLYYIDFDNKYGDGEGTIYLKAECTDNNCGLGTDATEGTRIKQFNPSLYAEGVKSPDDENDNIKATKWLLNENNWSSLKENLKEGGISSENDINYIVGAPSLEMMLDSYNTYYAGKLTGMDEPDGTKIKDGERRRIFYRYTGVEEYGYKVAPAGDTTVGGEVYDEFMWGATSLDNSIQSDSLIDSLYYPGEDYLYWLASPSSNHPFNVSGVSGRGGIVANGYSGFDWTCALCPLVSLKSSTLLKLQ